MLKRIMTKTIVRIFFTLGFVVALTLSLSGCSLRPNTATEPKPLTEVSVEELVRTEEAENVGHPAEAEYSYVASVSGQTALDLLKDNADVQLKEYEFGSFIEGINGVLGDEKQYWAFYVNREYANEAADKIILNVGDVTTFRLEPVEAFPTQASK